MSAARKSNFTIWNLHNFPIAFRNQNSFKLHDFWVVQTLYRFIVTKKKMHFSCHLLWQQDPPIQLFLSSHLYQNQISFLPSLCMRFEPIFCTTTSQHLIKIFDFLCSIHSIDNHNEEFCFNSIYFYLWNRSIFLFSALF